MLDDALGWPEVSALLAQPRNYWLGTTMPSGAPRAAPVWGVVTGGTLYVCSERRAVKAYAIRPQSAMTWHMAGYEASQRRWSA